MTYRIYGLIAYSEIPLPELAPITNEKFDLFIRHSSPSETFKTPSQWFMQWYLPNRELWLSFAKIDSGYLLRFKELADFFVSNNGQQIVCIPSKGIPSNTISHLLLNQVIPLIINLKGGEAIHASAVLTEKGVIAFSGNTRTGKSTVAGSFLCAGYSLMSDDCLVLLEKDQGIYALPAYPGLRLWEDSLDWLFGNNGNRKSVAHYTTKQRVCVEKNPGAYCDEPQPLRRVYAIAEPSETKKGDDIVIEALSPLDSIMELVKCAFRLDITDRDMLTRQLGFLKRVVSTVSVRRFIFPRNLQLLPAIREAILKDLKTF